MPIPTPRQSRKSSLEAECSTNSQCEPALPPPMRAELVAEFDPLVTPTPETNTAHENQRVTDVFYDSATVQDVGCPPKVDAVQAVPDPDDITATSTDNVDVAVIVDPERNNRKPFSADIVNNRSGDVRRSRASYLKVWHCSSSRPAPQSGISSNAMTFLPFFRETIRSDESVTMESPQTSTSLDNDDIFCTPALPMKRSLQSLSGSDPCPEASKVSSVLVPLRAAPPPPLHDSESGLPTGSSEIGTGPYIVQSTLNYFCLPIFLCFTITFCCSVA